MRGKGRGTVYRPVAGSEEENRRTNRWSRRRDVEHSGRPKGTPGSHAAVIALNNPDDILRAPAIINSAKERDYDGPVNLKVGSE